MLSINNSRNSTSKGNVFFCANSPKNKKAAQSVAIDSIKIQNEVKLSNELTKNKVLALSSKDYPQKEVTQSIKNILADIRKTHVASYTTIAQTVEKLSDTQRETLGMNMKKVPFLPLRVAYTGFIVKRKLKSFKNDINVTIKALHEENPNFVRFIKQLYVKKIK